MRSTISNGAALQQALLDNELDFAVIEGNTDREELAKRAIAPDRLVLILPPDDPRARQEGLELKDLAQDAFLLRDKGSVGRAFLGLGISFLPERLVEGAVRAGVVATKELRDETFVRENHIIWHRHKFLTASAKALMDCFCRMSWEPEDTLPL